MDAFTKEGIYIALPSFKFIGVFDHPFIEFVRDIAYLGRAAEESPRMVFKFGFRGAMDDLACEVEVLACVVGALTCEEEALASTEVVHACAKVVLTFDL